MRKIIITSALPYANGPLHIGHILEGVQTDIWARFQNIKGNQCWYFCADDAHGTPIMLKAAEQNQDPEKFIKPIREQHIKDFSKFNIEFSNYHTTHSKENRELANTIFKKLEENGDISSKTIQQAFDQVKNIFLPDRYVQGICPKCNTKEQHGDSCENCGATYSPLEMKDPISILSQTIPITKESEHLFFKLNNYQKILIEWLKTHSLQPEVKNKLLEWFKNDLRDWDISRDHPYFGFEIPNHPNKYFYVWLDAPIGYLASILNYTAQTSELDFDEIWNKNSDYEVYHFIGKDIIYFHALFWPAILTASNYRTPTSIFAHGFLTINGNKMSKSRGNFIAAKQYLDHLDPEHLRYYFAAKLSNTVEDIDFNLNDYMLRVNADLVGKFVNIASRCSGFLAKHFENKLANKLHNEELFNIVSGKSEQIATLYENREFSKAIRIICECADLTNQYIDQNKPWQLIKQKDISLVQDICTMGVNLFRLLTIYLKPIIPMMAISIENFLNISSLTWADIKSPLLSHTINKFTPLTKRIEESQLIKLQEHNMEQDKPKIENEHITIEDFSKVELRIAKIVSASHIEGADLLLKLELDVGEEKLRQVFAGIKKTYDPKDIEGRLTILVANLKPRKMRFGISEGMVLMACNKENVYMLSPDSGAVPGMLVK